MKTQKKIYTPAELNHTKRIQIKKPQRVLIISSQEKLIVENALFSIVVCALYI